MHFTKCFLEHFYWYVHCTMFTAHSSKIGISGYKVNLSMIVDLNNKILSTVYTQYRFITGRSRNLGVPVLIGGNKQPPPVGIGLTDLPKIFLNFQNKIFPVLAWIAQNFTRVSYKTVSYKYVLSLAIIYYWFQSLLHFYFY